MAYTHTNSRGTAYYLYQKDVTLKGGRVQRIYFFGKDANNPKGELLNALPEGRMIVENPKTGLPVLKKSE